MVSAPDMQYSVMDYSRVRLAASVNLSVNMKPAIMKIHMIHLHPSLHPNVTNSIPMLLGAMHQLQVTTCL